MKQFFFMLLAAASFCHTNAQSKTEFGVMSSSPYQSQADAGTMGINLVRTHVSLASGYGVNLITGKCDFATNIVWDNGSFTSDMNAYESSLTYAVSSMPKLPKYAFIENEETKNKDVKSYCKMFAKAHDVLAPKNVIVLNGGITNRVSVSLAIEYYKANNRKDIASYLSARNKTADKQTVANAHYEIDFLKKMEDVKMFAFHFQLEDATYCADMQYIITALKAITGKIPVNTEEAQRDDSEATTTDMINASKGMPLAILYITTGAAGNATTYTTGMKLAAAQAIK